MRAGLTLARGMALRHVRCTAGRADDFKWAYGVNIIIGLCVKHQYLVLYLISSSFRAERSTVDKVTHEAASTASASGR
jgi:hypothetical protein